MTKTKKAPPPTPPTVVPESPIRFVNTTAALQALLRPGNALHVRALDGASRTTKQIITLSMCDAEATTATTLVLQLGVALSTKLVQNVLNVLFADTRITKVVHNSALTMQWLHDHFKGLSMGISNAIDLQQALHGELQSADAMVFTKFFNGGGGGATNPYHDAVTAHVQKDPKAWSQPILAKKLLQYLAFQTRMYLECYKKIAKEDAKAATAAAGGGNSSHQRAARLRSSSTR